MQNITEKNNKWLRPLRVFQPKTLKTNNNKKKKQAQAIHNYIITRVSLLYLQNATN